MIQVLASEVTPEQCADAVRIDNVAGLLTIWQPGDDVPPWVPGEVPEP
jgi:hypothetical protein